ncbi:MAG: acyltransferase, partial [Aeromicrobium erythreum]
YPRGLIGAMLARLDVGVALFFVVSGFLLTLGFLRPASEGRPGPRLGDYAIKRALRIWPVFVVTLVVVHLTVARDVGAGSWVRSLTMTTLYGDRFFSDGLTQMWSLETEVAFYVLLPLLLLGSARLARRVGVLRSTVLLAGLLTAVNVVWVVALTKPAEEQFPFAHQWLPAYLDWFAAGMVLAAAWVARSHGSRHAVVRLLDLAGSLPGLCWTVAASVLLLASTPLAGPLDLSPSTTPATMLLKNLAYLAVGVLVVVPAVFGPPTRYRAALEHRVPRYLGQVSYAVFCIHLVVLHAVMAMTSTELFSGRFWLVAPLTLVLSVVAAIVLHHVVERPAVSLAGRLTRRGQPTSAAKDTTPSASSWTQVS